MGFLLDTLTNSLSNNPFTQLFNNREEYANQVFDYANQVWAREDSAYQRMVSDMKKAGLNPWLGISSGGSATSSVNPAQNKLDSLLATTDRYIAYTNSVRQFFGTGSQIFNDTMDNFYKIGNLIGNLVNMMS